MDYEKKYKEALAKAQNYYKPEVEPNIRISMENLFPELRESEDERIRKELIEYHKAQAFLDGKPNNKHVKYVAWLEKQGEHANFRNKIQIGDKVTRNEDGVLVNLSQLKRVAKKDEKQGEQQDVSIQINPPEYINDMGGNGCYLKNTARESTWSEEDEERLSDAIFFVREYQIPTRDKRLLNAAKETEDWLRTFKDRVQPQKTWKPADGDDLPEIDREVIALAQPYPNDEHLRVVFAHRPNKYAKVWNSDLGEKQVIEIERHGKGEWNIPNIKFWLDVELPKV